MKRLYDENLQPIVYFTKRLHAYAGKTLYINLLGMMFIGLLDGIGVLLFVPLLSIVGVVNIDFGTFPVLAYFAFLQHVPKEQGLLLILGMYVVLVTGQAVIQRNLGLRDVGIHTGFMNKIRLDLYRAIIQADWSFYIRKRKTDLINAMTGELGRVTNGSYKFIQFLASMVFTLFQIGLAFWLSAHMTLFVLCCGLMIAICSKSYIKRSKTMGTVALDLAQSYLAGITEHFNGIKDIKSNMLESSRFDWLQMWSNKIERERIENFKIRSGSQLFYKISSAVIISGFVYAAVMLFQTQGEQMLLVILLFFRLWPRFVGIQSNLEDIAGAVPAFKALMELQNECEKAKEYANGWSERIAPVSVQLGIQCRGVYFRYNRSEPKYALEHIQLTIPANRMTAIVGRSGAGKSTLIDLVMGLIQPEKGEVLLDGEPLSGETLLSLKRSISYVPQEPFLFHATIRENLLMVEPNASESQLWEALHFASAAGFVGKLPQGLDTIIGDRGMRLSGGERQRIVLARAMLRKPSILILDEATSALDTENEMKIQDALERLKGSMTIIVIAHRLSTIRNADQVIVLDEGRMVQHGEYVQLANEKKGLFSRLLAHQLKVASIER